MILLLKYVVIFCDEMALVKSSLFVQYVTFNLIL